MKHKPCLAALILALLFCLGGCAPAPVEKSDLINVTVSDGDCYYLAQNTYSVRRGDDLTVRLIFREGGYPEGCSYQNSKFVRVEKNYYDLTLYQIRYPEFVKITENDGTDAIRYYANGGEFAEGAGMGGYLSGKVSQTHLRTNTDLGTQLFRAGYIQTGWNTAADGSGVHIGLGSRVSAEVGIKTELYAEWEKALDASSFEYEIRDGACTLTKLKSDASRIVLPETVDGIPVRAVARGFCIGAEAEVLVIPRTVSVVEEGAFEQAAFETLYLFDNISELFDASFENCTVKSVRINASEPPRYLKDTEIAYFADAVDRLIALRDRKKIVFFSGCSFAYGLHSETVERAVGDEFEVVNVGVIGGTNAGFQLDILSAFMGTGDVLVHAPEVASTYQLMEDNGAESRMFLITEGNYDLLSLVDVSKIEGFFEKFAHYCNNRRALPPCDYGDVAGMYNEYGDICKPRDYTGEDKAFSEESNYTYHPEFVNERSGALLDSYYQNFRDRGVRVVLTYSPVNLHGLPSEDREQCIWERFEEHCNKYLAARGIEIISTASDYLLEGRYFYDTDYHLNDKGAEIRTERLLNDLKRHGVYGEERQWKA